jgi:PAS domain S-box-containing protein
VRIDTSKISNATVLAALIVALFMMLATHLVLGQVRQEGLRETGILQQNALTLFWELLRGKGSGFSIRGGKLWAGEYLIDGNNELPDKVKELTGSNATIFMGDTRVATNILLKDGRRALGTRLAGPAYDAIYEKGIPFRGETLILGSTYCTAYDPIRDSRGKIIGVLFVGTRQSDYLAAYHRINVKIQAINGTLACIFIFFAFLLLTERKRAQDAIQKQLQFLQLIIDTIPSPVFFKDAAGKYLGFNKSYESFVGLTREQMFGKTVHELWQKDLADRYFQMDQELFRNSGVQVYESSVRYADGTLHDVIFNKAVFRNQDLSIGGLVGVILDITERRAAEQERNRLEAQLHHSSMIKSLTIRLSHDLNTPLTPLFALLPMVREKVGDPQLARMLEICQTCVGQIQGLTAKALDLVRFSSKAVLPELVSLFLARAAEHSANGCATLFARRGITCLNTIDPELKVQGAADQLALLFDNLLSNAARYAAQSGVVRISAAARDGVVVVSVQNDGTGLEKGHEKLIFEEFFKADAARHDLSTQGLGLAICKSIVLNHNGRIWAESPGMELGTTVFFTLEPSGNSTKNL